MEESEHCHKTKRKNDRGDKLVQFVAVKEEKSQKVDCGPRKDFESSLF